MLFQDADPPATVRGGVEGTLDLLTGKILGMDDAPVAVSALAAKFQVSRLGLVEMGTQIYEFP